MKRNQILLSLLAIAVLFVAGMIGTSNAPSNAFAAPLPQITRVAQNSAVIGDEYELVRRVFDAEDVTADTRYCVETPEFEVADIQWVIDQTTTNTTTLRLQHSNDNVNFQNGQVIVSGNTSDASALNRYDLYGRYNCIQADVSNSNPVEITVLFMPRSE